MATYVYSFTKDASGVYRPFVPILIINPINKATVNVFGLLDTGADDSMFPKIVADTLGHDLKGDSAVFTSNQGIGENKVDLWKHPFRIHLLSHDRKGVVWKSKDCIIGCADHDRIPALLGSSTFLSNFKITFNYPTKKIIIEVS